MRLGASASSPRKLEDIVVGRKNWMFYGSNVHAESAAAIQEDPRYPSVGAVTAIRQAQIGTAQDRWGST